MAGERSGDEPRDLGASFGRAHVLHNQYFPLSEFGRLRAAPPGHCGQFAARTGGPGMLPKVTAEHRESLLELRGRRSEVPQDHGLESGCGSQLDGADAEMRIPEQVDR